jgi:hypothetical protein
MKCEINDKSVQLNIVQYITDCRVSQYAMKKNDNLAFVQLSSPERY